MGEETDTYCGERLDSGDVSPRRHVDEGFARLQCGGSIAWLDCTALGLLASWAAVGAEGFHDRAYAAEIIRALNVMACEASTGRAPQRGLATSPSDEHDGKTGGMISSPRK